MLFCRSGKVALPAIVSAVSASAISRAAASAAFVAPSHYRSFRSNLDGLQQLHLTRKMSGTDEIAAAKKAAASRPAVDDGAATVFDKILSGEWSSEKVHEDDLCLAFRDVNPQAPVHILVIPKNRDGLTMLSKAREDQKELLGHLTYVAQMVGKKECPQGFRVIINDGEHGGQSVYHLHVHVMGGRQMDWPPG